MTVKGQVKKFLPIMIVGIVLCLLVVVAYHYAIVINGTSTDTWCECFPEPNCGAYFAKCHATASAIATQMTPPAWHVWGH